VQIFTRATCEAFDTNVGRQGFARCTISAIPVRQFVKNTYRRCAVTAIGQDSLNSRRTLTVNGRDYAYYSLEAAAAQLGDVSRLPYSMKVLLENLLRFEDGSTVTVADVQAVVDWQGTRTSTHEINYRPARVLMQDFTGVPCVVDLAAMRDAITRLGGDPMKINPLVPVDLVIDHSVMVDEFGNPQAFEDNMAL
jgi:aconitate hydratase